MKKLPYIVCEVAAYTVSQIVSIVALLSVSTVVIAQSVSGLLLQEQQREQLQVQLQASQSLLYSLEELVNRSDPALLEPLEQIADKLMALYRFDEAHATLDRAMQLARVNEGLYTSTQLPFLRKKIENHVNRGDWESAQTLIEHIFWLYTKKTKSADSLVVEGLLHLSNIHLRGINEDDIIRRDYHFRKAASNSRLALRLGERVWGIDDPRLIPILYNQLKHYYIQSVAVDKGGRAGYALRRVSQGRGRLLDNRTSQRIFYSNGVILLNQMHDIYTTSEPQNLEGVAMAKLYKADWQVLFNRPDEAVDLYREAYLGMVEAGVSTDSIHKFFDRPVVLPVANFYQTVDHGLQARINSTPLAYADPSANPLFYVAFDEQSSLFPDIRFPGSLHYIGALESDFALISFSLTGSQGTSLDDGVHNFTALGVAEDVRVLDVSLATMLQQDAQQQDKLAERLNWLRFRPKLIEGVPHDANGLLKYLVAAKN